MSFMPWLPVPMTPSVMRLLGAGSSALPSAEAGTIRGTLRAAARPRNWRRVAEVGRVTVLLQGGGGLRAGSIRGARPRGKLASGPGDHEAGQGGSDVGAGLVPAAEFRPRPSAAQQYRRVAGAGRQQPVEVELYG